MRDRKDKKTLKEFGSSVTLFSDSYSACSERSESQEREHFFCFAEKNASGVVTGGHHQQRVITLQASPLSFRT